MEKGLGLRRIATISVGASGATVDSGDIRIPDDFENIVAFGLHSSDTTRMVQRATIEMSIDGKTYFFSGTHAKMFYASVNAGVEEILKDMKEFSADGTGIPLFNKLMNIKVTDSNAAGFAAYDIFVYIKGKSVMNSRN